MKTRNIVAIATAFTLGLISCSDKADTTAPTISVTAPAAHSHYDMGTEFSIDATFEDENLSYFHVHLGDESGNHVHELDYEATGNITGTSYHFTDTVQIPDSLGMMYWLHFEVVDTESNESKESVMIHFEM